MVVHPRHRRASAAAVCIAALSMSGLPILGAGLPVLHFQAGELFKPLDTLRAAAGTSWGNATFHKGHLIVGIDADEDSAGFQVWDISNPRDVRLVRQKYDAESRRLREIQNYAFAAIGGRDYVAIPSHAGLEIWDFTDLSALKRIGAVELARGGGKGIYNGIISAAWVPPYIYCGGMNTGLYVVDARNPAAPALVRRLPNSAVGGRLAGPVFALGPLLVATTMEDASAGNAVATFDLSDPADPRLVDLFQGTAQEGNYTAFMSGNRIYGHGVEGSLRVYEISPRFEVSRVGTPSDYAGRGGYGMYQDGYVHAGMSDRYVKYEVGGPKPLDRGRFSLDGDNDWVIPVGNLAFVGDDDFGGAVGVLVPHQAGPDTSGPRVHFALPAPGSRDNALSGRIGLSFTDNVDPASVGPNGFALRTAGGAAVAGTFSVLMGLVNFSPDAPLLPDTEYEVTVKAGVFKDWAGNGVPRDTAFRFTTGRSTALGPLPRTSREGFEAATLYWPGLPGGIPEGGAWRDALGRGMVPALLRGTPSRESRSSGRGSPIRPAPGFYATPTGDR